MSEFNISFFKPEFAEGIAALFRDVYGEGYPVKFYYDPRQLTRENSAGRVHSIVAFTSEGRVIGVHHLWRSATCPELYEWGGALVSREWRGAGVSGKLAGEVDNLIMGTEDIETVVGESVCNHLHMQRMVLRSGFVDMALEIAHMPEDAYLREKSAKARVAALLSFKTFRSRPHTVYLPAPYEKTLQTLYSELDDTRDLRPARDVLPDWAESRPKITIFDDASLARIAFYDVGSEFNHRLKELETGARKKNVLVIQLWLPLASPWVGAAVDFARNEGYFFGGLLPRWLGEDGMLMQKLWCEPHFEDISLQSERAKNLLGVVRQSAKIN